MVQNVYTPVNTKFADRKRFYDCFDSYYKDGTSEPIIKMVAEYVDERLQ